MIANKETLHKVFNLAFYTPGLFVSLSLLLCCICSCFAMGWQAGELCCHFVALYIVAASILLAFGLVDFAIRRSLTGPCATVVVTNLLVLAFGIYKMAPLYQRYEAEPAKSDLTLVHINLWGGRNLDRKSLFKEIAPYDPDVIVVSELEGSWANTLAENLGAKFPYISSHPQNGIGIYSKYPLINPIIRIEPDEHRARLLCKIDLKGHAPARLLLAHPMAPVGIMLVHPTVPIMPKARFDSRNKELTELYPQELKELGGEAILLGDLNCTPWSPYFDQLLAKANLKDSERGFGYTPSWPARCALQLPLVPFLPIDHVLVSPGIIVKERKLLGPVGSDHLPVMVKLALTR